MDLRVDIFGADERPLDRVPKIARWYGPGERVQIGHWVIPDGMVYAGGTIAEKRGAEYVVVDGCAIDPDLSVSSSDPDRTGSMMWYWPRYDAIDPRCRLAYLEWLSSGKCDPDAYTGYVFLYFYGIERRVFLEGFESNHELDVLTHEVQRLLEIYGRNNSFRGYASNFIETISLLQRLAANQPFEPVHDPEACGLSAETKVAIGRLLAHGQAIPFDWMMAWWLQDSSTRLRVSGKRCFPEFMQLMRNRFAERYPRGMQLEAPSSRLSLYYHGANATVSGDLSEVFHESLPDIETIRVPIDRLSDIAEKAMDDLSPYARLVGRKPELKTSLQTAALLPTDCRPDWLSESLATLDVAVANAERSGRALRLGELAELSGLPQNKKVGLKALETMAGLLVRLGVGMEPDPLYGRATVSKDDEVIIFRTSDDARFAADDAYCLALAMTTLVAGIAAASETGLGDAERRFLSWITTRLNLKRTQGQRLEAHLDWLISKNVRFTHVRKLMRELPAAERATMAALAVVVAKADGIVEQSEMQFLEQLFDELGIERQHLYGVLHQLPEGPGMPSDEPVLVQRGSANNGHAIPQQVAPPQVTNGVNLDPKRIKEVMDETRAVASILNNIFDGAEEEEEAADDSLEGLDTQHKALLSALLKRELWTRQELEQLTQACGLMTDGALDTINEWGWEMFGEAVLEDGESVLVYREVITVQEGTDLRG